MQESDIQAGVLLSAKGEGSWCPSHKNGSQSPPHPPNTAGTAQTQTKWSKKICDMTNFKHQAEISPV